LIKTVALGSPRALGSFAKPAAADKPGATSHCPFALLSSAFPVPLSVWDGAPQHPSVGMGLWSVGKMMSLSWSFLWLNFIKSLLLFF